MSRPDVSKLDESLSRLPLPAPPDTQPTDKEEFETLEATTSAARAHRDVELGGSSSLRVAVFEDSAHLGSVQSAIGAAGHLVVASGSGREAMRSFAETLASSSPDVVLVSLPGGEAVIDAALALEGRRPVVIASVDGAGISAVQRATTACADLVALKPHDASSLAPILFAASRLLIERKVVSAARGAEQVMRARLDEIADPEPRGLLPFEMFQRVIELEMRRARRFEYPLSIALFAVDVTPGASPPGIKGILRARAGNALIHTVRDIDVATQLDHERFLVLLPYTDVKGAAGLAQRVIAAIAAGSAVTAAGREYAPRAVGAVAGARLGEPVSFAKLMKDASKLLEQARRDAADLAVQP